LATGWTTGENTPGNKAAEALSWPLTSIQRNV